MIPALHEDLVLIHEEKRSYRHPIFVPSQVLADRGEPIEPLNPSIREVAKRALDHSIGGKKAEDTVQHDRGFWVVGGELSSNLRSGDKRPRASLGDYLKKVELQS